MDQFKPGSETNSKAIASIKTEDFTCQPKDRACGMIEKQGFLQRSSHLFLTLSIKIDKACSDPGLWITTTHNHNPFNTHSFKPVYSSTAVQ